MGQRVPYIIFAILIIGDILTLFVHEVRMLKYMNIVIGTLLLWCTLIWASHRNGLRNSTISFTVSLLFVFVMSGLSMCSLQDADMQWLEETVNTVSQLFLLVGMIFLFRHDVRYPSMLKRQE